MGQGRVQKIQPEKNQEIDVRKKRAKRKKKKKGKSLKSAIKLCANYQKTKTIRKEEGHRRKKRERERERERRRGRRGV